MQFYYALTLLYFLPKSLHAIMVTRKGPNYPIQTNEKIAGWALRNVVVVDIETFSNGYWFPHLYKETSTSNPFLCAADFSLKTQKLLGSC